MAKKKKSKAKAGGKKSQQPLRQTENATNEEQSLHGEETPTEPAEPLIDEPSPIAVAADGVLQREEADAKEDDGEDESNRGEDSEVVESISREPTEDLPDVALPRQTQEDGDLHRFDDIEHQEESPSEEHEQAMEAQISLITTDHSIQAESEEAEDELIPQTTEESEAHDLPTDDDEHTAEKEEKKDDANEATMEVSKDDDEDGEEESHTSPLAESSAQFLGTEQEPQHTTEEHRENETLFEEQIKPTVSCDEDVSDQEDDKVHTVEDPVVPIPEVVTEAETEAEAEPTTEPVSEREPESQEAPKEEDQQESTHELPVNELISSTEGPYTLSPLKLDIPPSMGTLSAFCHFEGNIIVGTSLGYILSYTPVHNEAEIEYILTSQVQFHATRQFPVTTILPLHTLQILLVVSGSLLQCFSLPTPTPLSIGRVKDVEGVELDLNGNAKCDENGVHVVIMTKSQLRVVNVTKQALRLVKDIKVGAKCGKRRADRMIISHEGKYDILDINREVSNRTELFNVNTMGNDAEELMPFVQGVGKDEFLLVCGTGKSDPAMGLVINSNGDISRGTIPMIQYPDNVITDGDVAIVVSGSEVTTYSLEDQREVQSWKFSMGVNLNKVEPMKVNSEPLVNLITLKAVSGENSDRDDRELQFAKKISQVQSSVVCFSDNSIRRLVPQSRLERLQSVPKLRTLEKELASSLATTELTVIEVEYLNLHISLRRLLEHKYDEAIEGWTNGSLDPRILIYAFNYDVYGEVYMFNGLISLVEKLKASIKETSLKNFFEIFLERWISKKSVENQDIITTLEMTAVLYYLDDHKQLLWTLQNISLVDVIPILRSNKKHLALANIYAESAPLEAIYIHKDLVDNKISDLGFDKDDSLHIICELGNLCDEEDRRETGMWLLKHDAKLAISFMNSSKLSLHSLQAGANRTEEVKNVIESIDDIGLKYEYMSQVFVSMGQEKMKLGLKKGLYRSLLKSLTSTEKAMRVSAQKL